MNAETSRNTDTLHTIAELKRLYEAATPGPWSYRPHEYDDWGFIRGPSGEIVATARAGGDFDAPAHRRENTDPYGPNAKLIVAAINALPALLAKPERGPAEGTESLREKLARTICDEEWMGSQPWDRKPQSFRDRYLAYADAILALPEFVPLSPAPAAVREGEWQLVPVQPTEDMLDAGVQAGVAATPKPWAPATWAAMLRASPRPTPIEGGEIPDPIASAEALIRGDYGAWDDDWIIALVKRLVDLATPVPALASPEPPISPRDREPSREVILLEALKLAEKWAGEFNCPPNVWPSIRAVIATAEGRS